MSPLSQNALEMQHSPTKWDYALEALLVLLLAFCPLAFGARDDWTQQAALGLAAAWSPEIVLVLAATMAAILAGRQVAHRHTRFVWSGAYFPIVLFLLLGLLQLAPLPVAILGTISPQTLHTKTELLGHLPLASGSLHSLTLSFYPLATQHDLWMLLAVVTVFVVVLNVYRRSAQIKRLLLAVSLIGFAVALMAVYQNAFGSRLIYGVVGAVHFNSGPFLNHNAFSQFMNLSIGAMLALLLVRISEMTEGSDNFEDSFQLLRSAKLNAVYALAGAIVISAATIFLSLSRGGMLSLMIAGAATGVLLVWRRGYGGIGSILLMFAIGAVLVTFFVAAGSVFERVATLRHAAQDNGDRAHVVEYLSHLWRQYPLLGTGLGTHRYVFPMFDQSVIFSFSSYAENEYAQLMEETGAVGVALCLAFMLIVAASYLKAIWHPRRPIHVAAYGLGYGLLAILVQSASDFGQHDAANACLTATFAALVIVISRHARPIAERRSGSRRSRAWYSRPLRLAAGLATVCVFVLPLCGADASRRARVAWSEAAPAQESIENKGWENGTDKEYEALLVPAKKAAEIEPDDVFIGYWLNAFRWNLLERYRDPHTGLLSLNPESVKATEKIVNELNRLHPICPTYGAVYSLAGRLEYFVLGRPEGQMDIRTGYRLDHNDPDACLAVAELDASLGRWEQSMVESRRALQLDLRSTLGPVLHIYVTRGHPDIAHELATGNLEGLDALAYLLRDDPKQEELATRCRNEATALLFAAANAPDASADTLASVAEVYDRRGQAPEAIDYFERALAKNYGQVEWRLRLAQLLAKSGNVVAAEKEARAVLRISPSDAGATRLLIELGDPAMQAK